MLDESTPIETTYHHLHYFKSLTKHIYYSYSQSACTETFEILKALKPLNYKTKKLLIRRMLKKKKKKTILEENQERVSMSQPIIFFQIGSLLFFETENERLKTKEMPFFFWVVNDGKLYMTMQ